MSKGSFFGKSNRFLIFSFLQ